jgi:N-glycosylase/DNA lyase
LNNFSYTFSKNEEGGSKIRVSDIGSYSLKDTLECGQCFRYECIRDEGGECEYIVTAYERVFRVASPRAGELIFYDISEEDFLNIAVPYFSLDTDYIKIKNDIISRTDSQWLKDAAEAAQGIAILRQDPWETLFSFIISQNNNIPRIRKIIRRLSAEYGVNICLQNRIKKCPLGKIDSTPCEEICKECGACYTFPKAEDVAKHPEKMLCANPGFRYKYLLSAANSVVSGKTDLMMIGAARSYEYTKTRLMEIKGVGEKVAACTALFGFGNLEAFPIDVWMRRAIDEHFGGKLDPLTLGRYAGVAQQYIFHYKRTLEKKEDQK